MSMLTFEGLVQYFAGTKYYALSGVKTPITCVVIVVSPSQDELHILLITDTLLNISSHPHTGRLTTNLPNLKKGSESVV